MLNQLFGAGGTKTLSFRGVFLFLESYSALSSEQNDENVFTYLQVDVYDMQYLSSLSILRGQPLISPLSSRCERRCSFYTLTPSHVSRPGHSQLRCDFKFTAGSSENREMFLMFLLCQIFRSEDTRRNSSHH